MMMMNVVGQEMWVILKNTVIHVALITAHVGVVMLNTNLKVGVVCSVELGNVVLDMLEGQELSQVIAFDALIITQDVLHVKVDTTM